MIDTTKILRKLTTDEIAELKHELNTINHLWQGHSPDLEKYPTALRMGKTVHLNMCSNDLVLYHSILETLPHTKKIISDTVGLDHTGRAYWHRLLPGDKIEFHTDADVEFVRDNKLEHRYQIYLDCMPGAILVLDGMRRDNNEFEYTVVDFDLTRLHYYNNRSTEPWYFLVFDALNQPLS